MVPADRLARTPSAMPWAVAGGLSGVGQAALTALEALEVRYADTFLVSGAAGGVGTVAAQLARAAGATVTGTAREENHAYLRHLGTIPVAYGNGLVDRVRELAPGGVDVALDAAGEDGLRAAVALVADRDRVGTVDACERLGARWIAGRRSAARLGVLVRLWVAGALHTHVRAA